MQSRGSPEMSRPGPSPSVVAQCGGERERERERERGRNYTVATWENIESIDECTLCTAKFSDFHSHILQCYASLLK